MADEFVDFYEALELPMDADRKEVRRRINEVYLEAQRNLDHRDFKQRIKHQEMFEMVLPRARYILLDEGRRDDYDRLVAASRSAGAAIAPPASAPAPAPGTDLGQGNAAGFRLAPAETNGAMPGKAPSVEGLPTSSLDPAQVAKQRDEMWAKWKSGLEAAIARDESSPKADAPRPASAPSQNPEPPAPRPPRAPASAVAFDFGKAQIQPSAAALAAAAQAQAEAEEETVRKAALELEEQKTERKRAVMKDVLAGVGMKGLMIGGLGTAVPLGALLIFGMNHLYPSTGEPLTKFPAPLAWVLGLAAIGGAAFFAAKALSKNMRRKTSMELSALPIEELLRKVGRSY